MGGDGFGWRQIANSYFQRDAKFWKRALACGRQLLLRADVGGTDGAWTVIMSYDVEAKEQVYPSLCSPELQCVSSWP